MKENLSAQNKTRTCTALRPLVPETSVSTNFTIWAVDNKIEKIYQHLKRDTLVSIFFVRKTELSDIPIAIGKG